VKIHRKREVNTGRYGRPDGLEKPLWDRLSLISNVSEQFARFP